MPETEDLVIDLDATPATGGTPKQAAKAAADAAVPETIDGIDDLKDQLKVITDRADAERTARLRADAESERHRAEAAKARQEAAAATEKAAGGEYSSIVAALDASKTKLGSLQQSLTAAWEAAQYGEAAKIQVELARAAADERMLEEGKTALEARQEAVSKTAGNGKDKSAAPERKTADDSSDPVECYIRQFTPRSQNWLREHKEFVTDDKKNRKLIAADAAARADDFIPDTDAYFDFIDRQLGLKGDEAAVSANGSSTTTRSRPMAAAPVSRDTSPSPTNGALKSGQIVLTPGEQLVATDGTHVWNHDDPSGKFKKGDPIGVQEMAKRKAALQKQGAYDRNYTDQ